MPQTASIQNRVDSRELLKRIEGLEGCTSELHNKSDLSLFGPIPGCNYAYIYIYVYNRIYI
jgi:hypothetical protein